MLDGRTQTVTVDDEKILNEESKWNILESEDIFEDSNVCRGHSGSPDDLLLHSGSFEHSL